MKAVFEIKSFVADHNSHKPNGDIQVFCENESDFVRLLRDDDVDLIVEKSDLLHIAAFLEKK